MPRIKKPITFTWEWLFIVAVVCYFGGYMQHFFATKDDCRKLNNVQATVQSCNNAVVQLAKEVRKVQQIFRIEPEYIVTAYSNDDNSINVPRWRDGLTSTGKRTRRGICAADWDYLKPGTLIWVPNYGLCEIQDRGSAIKGKRIDLFYEDVKDALEWGYKKIPIVIAER